jgi:uncharacterized protein YjbJ (UPF0337 family)
MGKKAKRLAKKVAALNAEVASLKTQIAHARSERKGAKVEIGPRSKNLRAGLERAKKGSEGVGKGVRAEVLQKKKVLQAKMNRSPKPVNVVEQAKGIMPSSAIDLNKQEVKGRQEQADGKLRGEAGKRAGNLEERIMGKAQEVQGTLREAVGRTARRIDEKQTAGPALEE